MGLEIQAGGGSSRLEKSGGEGVKKSRHPSWMWIFSGIPIYTGCMRSSNTEIPILYNIFNLLLTLVATCSPRLPLSYFFLSYNPFAPHQSAVKDFIVLVGLA